MKHIKLYEDFTDTHFNGESEDFTIRVYSPDEEVAHTEKIKAKDKDEAIDLADAIVSKIEGYNEDEGWDYSII